MQRSILVGLTLLVVLIFSQQVELTSLDLGRHLANGREIWNDSGLLFKNFYSYTEPDFPFVNHHWLSGVVYHAAYLAGGFTLLSFLNIALWLAAAVIAWKLARKRAGFYWAAVLALPASLLLARRTDIRPEVSSYVLILLVWLFLERTADDGKLKRLAWLIPLFAIWANLHIYFFAGLALLAFWSTARFVPPAWEKLWGGSGAGEVWQAGWQAARGWVRWFAWAVLACLFNPNTWRGLIYPFSILREYGYDIAENKSVFFLEKLTVDPGFFIFKAGLVVLALSFFVRWLVRREIDLFETLVALFFSGLALFASRNLALFSLVAFVLASRNLAELSYLSRRWPCLDEPALRARLGVAGMGAIIFMILVTGVYLCHDSVREHKFIKHPFGWNLEQGTEDSVDFFRESGLSGPIFNNYDLGSALIFWHYPQEKVFVDNRPEAYSVSFFKEIYRPMQENAYDWEKYRQQYGIKTIYFGYADMTPWARSFLARILKDPDWSLLYLDRYVVILADRRETDNVLLDKYGLDANALRARIRALASEAGYNSRLNLAFLAATAGQPDISEEIFRQMLLDYADDGRVLAALGTYYASTGNPVYVAQSINYLSRAIAAGYVLPSVYNTRGLARFSRGEYEEAARDWQEALKLDRKDSGALSYLEQLKTLQKEGRVPTGDY